MGRHGSELDDDESELQRIILLNFKLRGGLDAVKIRRDTVEEGERNVS